MLRFGTTNAEKVTEARAHLSEVADVTQFDYDYAELQCDDLAEIAAHGAREAFEAAPGTDPVFVDDTGFYIRGLRGFPGPYAAYVEHTLGVDRVWEVAADLDDRHAAFTCAIGYADETGVETFEASLEGTLVPPRGSGGFGYDPIFEYKGSTLAERSTEEKNVISHRARALTKLADWLESQED
jgi:XTP/dITP diphosphohydrolase